MPRPPRRLRDGVLSGVGANVRQLRDLLGHVSIETTASTPKSRRSRGEVLADTFSDLRKPLREAYERIRELFWEEGGPVSRRDLREKLSVPDSTARRWLWELVELEYLEVVEMGHRLARLAAP